MKETKIVISAFLIALVSSAFAQAPTQAVSARLTDYNNNPGPEAATDLMSALIQAAMEGRTVPRAADSPALDLNEGRRLALTLLANRQDGAPVGVGAGSSLVNLMSVSDLISGALESGAFSKSTQGTVATFRADVVGGYRLFTGDCPNGAVQAYPACVTEDPSPWRGLSIAFSFDSSRNDQITPSNPGSPGNSVSALLLRAQKGLAAVNLRYEFFRPRNQTSKSFKDAWMMGVSALRSTAGDYATALGEGPASLVAEAIREGKQVELDMALKDLMPEQRLAAAETFVGAFLAAPGHQVAAEKRAAYLAARKMFLKSEVELFQNTLQRRIVTAEYTHQRPKDEPEYGSVRVIWSFTAGHHHDEESDTDVSNWEITLNAGSDFFYETLAGQKDRRLRDFQTAFQADRKLWRWKFLNQPTFTLAGYYQRLTDDMVLEFNSDAIVPNTDIPLPKPANVILKGTKGDVGIAQIKLGIPLSTSGVSFPIAISWSNRTELLKVPGNDVRAHFGVLFDLDKLLTSLKR